MSTFRAVMLALLGIVGLGYVGRSLGSGVINAGGKGRDFFVSFADSPGMFVFAVAVIVLLSIGAQVVAWRTLTSKSNE